MSIVAITRSPAELLGIEDRVGSIEKGKDGDLVLFNGDPFEYRTQVCAVVIEGQPVSDHHDTVPRSDHHLRLEKMKAPAVIAALAALVLAPWASARNIISDYYVLKAQNEERWEADDRDVEAVLEDFRAIQQRQTAKHHILIDDMGFGDMGIPELNSIPRLRNPKRQQARRPGMHVTVEP